METRLAPSRLLLIAAASAGLAVFGSLILQLPSYTILSHGFRMFGTHLAVFFGLWAVFFAALWFAARRSADDGGSARVLVPFLFLLFAPAVHMNYMTRDDLRTRLWILAVAVGLAALYLWAADRPSSGKYGKMLGRWRSLFESLPLKRKLILLFFAAFIVYNLCTFVLVSKGITFSGDEPNYLLTSHSLLYDRDINLANNYTNQDYFHFYSRRDNPRLSLGIYGHYGKKGHDYIYPINLPGISVLMLPWYWLSQRLSGLWLTFVLKGSLSIWAVLLGLQVFLLARDLWRREGLALGLWAVYAFSSPVLFYATHLYPEILIALFSVYVYRKTAYGSAPSTRQLVFLGFLLGTFPWFGLKYAFLFGPLLLVGLYHLWKRHGLRLRLLAFLAVPVVSVLLFYGFIYALYGTFSPFTIYEGIMSAERSQAYTKAILDYSFWERAESFLDYFLDQRDGLLLYAPVYFFLFLGFVELFRKSKKEFAAVLLIALPYLGNYAFFTHRQGSCPPGRVLAPLSWIGIVLIGYFLVSNKNRVFRALFGAAAAATAAVTLVLLFHPSFLYQPTTHEVTLRAGKLFLFLSNVRFFLPSLLPSFLKINNGGYLPNYAWTAAIIIGLILYAVASRKERKRFGPAFHTGAAVLALVIVFVLWVFYPRVVLTPAQTFTYSSGERLVTYLFPLGADVVAKNEGEFWLHVERTYRVLVGAAKKPGQFKLVFGSAAGIENVAIRFFDRPVFAGTTSHEKKEIGFVPPTAVSCGRIYLYQFDVTVKKTSDEDLRVDPYLFQVIPLR